jgi:hypothetical protein
VVGDNRHGVGCTGDGHRRDSGEQGGQMALVRGVQVLDEHEGQASLFRQMGQEVGSSLTVSPTGATPARRSPCSALPGPMVCLYKLRRLLP